MTHSVLSHLLHVGYQHRPHHQRRLDPLLHSDLAETIINQSPVATNHLATLRSSKAFPPDEWFVFSELELVALS